MGRAADFFFGTPRRRLSWTEPFGSPLDGWPARNRADRDDGGVDRIVIHAQRVYDGDARGQRVALVADVGVGQAERDRQLEVVQRAGEIALRLAQHGA